MNTGYLKGKKIAREIRERVKMRVSQMKAPPTLASILASGNAAILQYVESQKKACEEVGIHFKLHTFPETSCCEEIAARIQSLNDDKKITGILVLLPLPAAIQSECVQQAIAPHKDVEGITPHNLGNLFYGNFTIVPCTAKAVWLLIESTGLSLAGKELVIVSQSRIVGAPLVLMALCSKTLPTVTCCHKETQDLASHVCKADILVVAAGSPGLITGDMVKPGAIVIDVGRNEVGEGEGRKIVGDVAGNVWGKASLLTPIQDGVGIVTTSVLMENMVKLAELQ